MDVHDLPAINAILNGSAAILLLRGYSLIRAGKRDQHKKTQHKYTMISAFAVSTVFLVSYLIYHANVGAVYFEKTGFIRYVYLTILFTHTVLAATVPVLAIITLRRALKAEKTGDFSRHRRIARWTLPIWLYVSVTGVIVYLMLYWL